MLFRSPKWYDDELAFASDGPRFGPMCDIMIGVVFPGVPEMANILPDRFSNEKASGLIAEVTPEGPNEFLIRITTDPPAADAADAVGAADSSGETETAGS